ncbi:MAG TPA: hypothetical protein IAC74_02200 [Candidatus Aphodoplasma excrementigallinarum]|uniref:Uncharacterized protein n=1 Tax=Candidatus Aphodoplasma excrementigallinarum TaxID=2840673 RepID=A0A9D1NGS6_9FIRM|nr:hypothetical protein [Candidatus Aphodoplasma excrementigallinarum]
MSCVYYTVFGAKLPEKNSVFDRNFALFAEFLNRKGQGLEKNYGKTISPIV